MRCDGRRHPRPLKGVHHVQPTPRPPRRAARARRAPPAALRRSGGYGRAARAEGAPALRRCRASARTGYGAGMVGQAGARCAGRRPQGLIRPAPGRAAPGGQPAWCPHGLAVTQVSGPSPALRRHRSVRAEIIRHQRHPRPMANRPGGRVLSSPTFDPRRASVRCNAAAGCPMSPRTDRWRIGSHGARRNQEPQDESTWRHPPRIRLPTRRPF